MHVEHHDLNHDFPNLTDEIHALKTGSGAENGHFLRLFDEYHALTAEVERLEAEDIPVDDFSFEELKKKRIRLKDELYQMIVAYRKSRQSA